MKTFSKHRATRLILGTSIAVFFALMFLPFFTPILLAVLFAFALEPSVSRLSRKTSKRRLPAVLFLVAIFLAVALPIVGVTYRVIKKAKEYAKTGIENVDLFKRLQGFVDRASSY